MARIFISYSRKDGSPVANELADRLRAFDHQVFLDVQSIRAGTRWRSELQRRVAWADMMIVLVTPGSNASDYVRGEVALAEKLNRPILPIQVNNTRAPDHLRSEWQIIKLEGDNYDRVLLEIEYALQRLPPRSPIRVRSLLVMALIIAVVAGVVLSVYNQPSQISPPTPDNTVSASATADTENGSPTVNEDFEDQVADGWANSWGQPFTFIDDGTGNHVVRSAAEGEVFYEPSADWHDYAVELDYRVIHWNDVNDTGVVLSLRRGDVPDCHRYDFVLHPDRLVVGASDNDCEDFAYFDETLHSNEPGAWHTLYAEIKGTQLQWRLDNGEMQNHEDERFAAGSLGIMNLHNTEIWFDNLRIWQLN